MLSFKQYLNEKEEWKPQEGESEIVHHYTTRDFNQFHPLSHFGTSKAARRRSLDLEDNVPTVHSVRLKLGKVVHIPDVDEEHLPRHILSALHYSGHITDEEHSNHIHAMNQSRESEHKGILLGLLKKKKINTLSYTNSQEDVGSKSYIITHPSQVRTLSKRVNAKINNKRALEILKTGEDKYHKGFRSIVHKETPLAIPKK